MDDFTHLHLVSPPSSLPDGLLAPRVSTPPVPRPRKASSLSLSSTPKHLLNARHMPHVNGHDYQMSKNSRGHQQGMHRAPSLDSATHRDLPLSPIARIQDAQSDSETEDDCTTPYYRGSVSRLSNGSHHCKHFKKPHQHSHSLPATPRVNSNSHPSSLNGNFPLGSLSPYHGIPCLMAPNTPNNSNQDNISQTSQYITCQTGVSHLESSVFLDQPKLPGAIDYSSLPLPHENPDPVRRPTDMSRHLSEPCITESQGECSSIPCSNKKRGTRNHFRTAVLGKENGLMDNIKESGQSEGESEEIHAFEVQWRFIQTLVAELNTTKCNNRKLMAELHQAKMEIQVLKASLDSYTESGLQPGAITEMVSQIHAAQKVRDEAMMSRIKLANEERDAALTHTRALLDKLSLSPCSNVEQGASVETAEQEIPSGGNSSCTSSPRRNDRRHRRSSVSSYSSATPLNSAPGACFQGSETRSAADREASTLAQLTTLEEELRTLRLATTIHHAVHEGDEVGMSSFQAGISRVSAEYMEGLCSQLRESEASRWQLHDQCTRLERLVNVLRKKVNGLSTLETTGRQEATKLTLVDLTLHRPNSDAPPSSVPTHLPTSTSSEGEPKDSLSSLESVETASASSWRRGDVPALGHSPTVLHSSSISHHETTPSTVLSSHHAHHSSLVNSTLSQSSSEKSVPINSSPSNYSSASSHTPHVSPHHRQQGSSDVTESPRNIPGVTIVGPITEL